MTHAVRTRIRTFCLAVLPMGMVISLLLLFPLAAFSQTPSFSTHSFSSAAGNVVQLHGDFNNDGYEDLITGIDDFSFRVYLSKGDGTYRAPIVSTFPNGSRFVGSYLLGDFNGDGKLDLAAATGPPLGGGPFGVSTYLGNGDGTFRTPINSTFENFDVVVAAADVNHDGKLDLVVLLGPDDDSVQVQFGNGDGSFTPGPITTADITFIDTILTGDFDGDGNVDVVVAEDFSSPGTNGSQFEVFSGDGTGNFAITYEIFRGYHFILTAADVNGDGISDLISPTHVLDQAPAPSLTVFYGAPNRAMQMAQIPTERCPVLSFASSPIAVADFNGDHIPDIAFSDKECNGTGPTRITLLPGKGDNQFGFDIPVFSATSISAPVFSLRGNRDTKADLVFTAPSSKNTPIITLLNATTGNFPTCAPPNAATGIVECSPAAGSTVSSPVNFAIGAAAAQPIRKVEVWVDREKQTEQFAGAFSNYGFLNASLPLAAGSHRVSVIAYGWDNSQISKVSTLNVSASSSCSAPSSAGVHICAPASGSSVSSPVKVQATAKVTGTIASTQLWVDGVKKSSVASSALNTSVSVAAGTHRFAVISVNTAGQKWESAVNATVK